LVRHRDSAEAVAPLVTALGSRDRVVAARANETLRDLSLPAAVDALCGIWAGGRDGRVGAIVAECRYQASEPAQLRVLSGLQAGRIEELTREGAEAVPALVAALADGDTGLAAAARRVLEGFAAPEALVDYVLDHAAGAPLIPVLDARPGAQHPVEGRWFLYLALAGRFDEYLAADFQFQTLRAEFRAAPPALQDRVRQTIVRSGDVRMNPLFVEHRDTARRREVVLADLSAQDAEALVAVNVRYRNWDDLFRFFWVLPARQIRAATLAMRQAKWRPADAERNALYQWLVRLAEALGEPPQGNRALLALLNPVLRDWFDRGRTAWKDQPAERLLERLKEDIGPEDQVAALGALEAQGRLTAGALAEAGRHPQWLVRLVAAGLGGPVEAVNDGGREWFARLQPALDAERVWGVKPCQLAVDGRDDVDRDALAALEEGLAALGDGRSAGGLGLVQAVVAHYTAHEIEIDVGAHALVTEDGFDITT
jgi:hypothetical protein